MEAPKLTLAEFLLARIAEDETYARNASGGQRGVYPPLHWYVEEEGGFDSWAISTGDNEEDANLCVTCNDSGGNELLERDARHMARWDPARVVTECEAKRRIVANCEAFSTNGPTGTPPLPNLRFAGVTILRLLALPYADHPDYRQEWKP
jgi:hypothetical protein